MTINELREVFNLAPREDGDVIMQDLNHIDSTIANDYQLGEESEEDTEEINKRIVDSALKKMGL